MAEKPIASQSAHKFHHRLLKHMRVHAEICSQWGEELSGLQELTESEHRQGYLTFLENAAKSAHAAENGGITATGRATYR